MGPAVDQRQDEKQMFLFNIDTFNQRISRNPYATNIFETETSSQGPYWGDKLLAPAWYSVEKEREFFAQMAIKKEFE